ncbi:MAG: hypothetical protein R2754_05535 [Microthrixaceae bacterium]
MARRLPVALIGALLSVFAIGCGVTALEADSPDDDYKYRPGQGAFSVVFPSSPEIAPVDQQLGAGITMSGTQASFEAPSGTYGAMIAAYPNNVPLLPLEQGLHGARDGAISAASARLGDSKPIEINGHHGIRFNFSVDGGVGEAAVFNKGRHMYIVIGVGREEARDRFAKFVGSIDFEEG